MLADVATYKDLDFLKAEEDGRPVTETTKISVDKVVNAFNGFGYEAEGQMVRYFLTSIGSFDQNRQCYVFSPFDVQSYISELRDHDQDYFSDFHIEHLVRGLKGVFSPGDRWDAVPTKSIHYYLD